MKQVLRKLRSLGTSWMHAQTLAHLEAIRLYELGVVLDLLPARGRLLEIGAGSGWQARALEARGYEVSAIDLPTSNYREARVWPVTEYDGRSIPFADDTFDIVYSSNVLEHIPHVADFQREIHRVLRRDGVALHLVPSSSWRAWTILTHLLREWTLPEKHGEHARNALSEIRCFSRGHWARLFRETGWTVVEQRSNGLFYTGKSIMDARWNVATRRRLGGLLGGSCNIFILREAPRA